MQHRLRRRNGGSPSDRRPTLQAVAEIYRMCRPALQGLPKGLYRARGPAQFFAQGSRSRRFSTSLSNPHVVATRPPPAPHWPRQYARWAGWRLAANPGAQRLAAANDKPATAGRHGCAARANAVRPHAATSGTRPPQSRAIPSFRPVPCFSCIGWGAERPRLPCTLRDSHGLRNKTVRDQECT